MHLHQPARLNIYDCYFLWCLDGGLKFFTATASKAEHLRLLLSVCATQGPNALNMGCLDGGFKFFTAAGQQG